MQKRVGCIIILLLIASLAQAEAPNLQPAPAPPAAPPTTTVAPDTAIAAPAQPPTGITVPALQSKCPQGAKCIALEKEQDLTKYGCKGCVLKADKYRVELNEKEGMLLYLEDKAKLSEFPDGTKFIVTEKGIEVILPKKLNKLPQTGSFTIDAKEEMELPEGQKLKGKVAVVEGQMKLVTGNSVTINNVEIRAEKNNVDIGFGKVKKDAENFVNFGKALTVHGDGFRAQLLPGNAYAKVEANDLLMLAPHHGGTMVLTPRDNTVPSLTVTGPDGAKEWGTLWNGQYKTTFGEKGIVKNSIENLFGKKMGSVPLGVDVIDEKGIHLIKDKNGKPYTLLYDNENRQYILPEGVKISTDGKFICPSRGKIGSTDSLPNPITDQ